MDMGKFIRLIIFFMLNLKDKCLQNQYFLYKQNTSKFSQRLLKRNAIYQSCYPQHHTNVFLISLLYKSRAQSTVVDLNRLFHQTNV